MESAEPRSDGRGRSKRSTNDSSSHASARCAGRLGVSSGWAILVDKESRCACHTRAIRGRLHPRKGPPRRSWASPCLACAQVRSTVRCCSLLFTAVHLHCSRRRPAALARLLGRRAGSTLVGNRASACDFGSFYRACTERTPSRRPPVRSFCRVSLQVVLCDLLRWLCSLCGTYKPTQLLQPAHSAVHPLFAARCKPPCGKLQ
jgi:hypothetical protein